MSPGDCVHIIDDDDWVALSLEALVRIAGAGTHRFRTAEEFLTLANQLPPGIVLIDYTLPGLDGIAAARELWAAGYHWPVIIMTGADPDETAAANDWGDAIIPKPCDVALLFEALEKARDSSYPNDLRKKVRRGRKGVLTVPSMKSDS